MSRSNCTTPHDEITQEVAAIVSEAAHTSGFLRVGENAFRVWKAHPNCGVTGRDVADALLSAAINAGVAIEFLEPREPLTAYEVTGPND